MITESTENTKPLAPFARKSMICGILGALCLPLVASIPAIILGHKASKAIKQAKGAFRGDGLALGGLILGYIGVLYGLGLIALVPYLNANRHKALDPSAALAQEAFAEAQISAIAKGCLAYAEANQGMLPASIPVAVPDRQVWASPYDPNRPVKQPSFRLLHAGKRLDELGPLSQVRLIEDRYRSWGGKRLVAYADGRLAFEDE